ncbi:hypothetical protein [Micromonospora sp. NPDC023888]|uniref:hypothetical protein n=1 Tax=Micromonospora sp. NPDC023888 TaxID=3155607 RepID=UPI0033C2B0FC
MQRAQSHPRSQAAGQERRRLFGADIVRQRDERSRVDQTLFGVRAGVKEVASPVAGREAEHARADHLDDASPLNTEHRRERESDVARRTMASKVDAMVCYRSST